MEWLSCISIMTAAITIIWKLIEALASAVDGTFSLGQLLARKVNVNFHGKRDWQHLPMSFLNNWSASWSDLLIFPIVNALVVPYLCGVGFWWILFLSVGIWGSIVFHRAWWGHDENLGHVFMAWNVGVVCDDRVDVRHNNFYDDMTSAGWIHLWFMAVQVAIICGFIFMPMPPLVVFFVSVLLFAFIVLQQAQAVFIQNGTVPRAVITTIVEIMVIVAISIIKLT